MDNLEVMRANKGLRKKAEEISDSITFELDAVPRAARDDLARALLLAVDAYFKQPSVETRFQAWLVDYKKRKATKTVKQCS